MAERLGAHFVRLYLNRPWQCAIVIKLLDGPLIAWSPASLLSRHVDRRLVPTDEVAQLPEPMLR